MNQTQNVNVHQSLGGFGDHDSGTLHHLHLIWMGWEECCISKRGERQRQRNKLMVEMEKRLGKTSTDTALEISHCDMMHVPEFHKEPTFQH